MGTPIPPKNRQIQRAIIHMQEPNNFKMTEPILDTATRSGAKANFSFVPYCQDSDLRGRCI